MEVPTSLLCDCRATVNEPPGRPYGGDSQSTGPDRRGTEVASSAARAASSTTESCISSRSDSCSRAVESKNAAACRGWLRRMKSVGERGVGERLS
jgi:hypothetical protein